MVCVIVHVEKFNAAPNKENVVLTVNLKSGYIFPTARTRVNYVQFCVFELHSKNVKFESMIWNIFMPKQWVL